MAPPTWATCRFDGRTLAWISDEGLTELDDGPAPGVRSIMEDKDGNFWFSNNIPERYKMHNDQSENQDGKLDYTVLKGIDTAQEPDLNPFCMAMAQDKNGDFWMVTYLNGVWRYDGANFTHYPYQRW